MGVLVVNLLKLGYSETWFERVFVGEDFLRGLEFVFGVLFCECLLSHYSNCSESSLFVLMESFSLVITMDISLGRTTYILFSLKFAFSLF